MSNSTINGQFSRAMLVYQRVYLAICEVAGQFGADGARSGSPLDGPALQTLGGTGDEKPPREVSPKMRENWRYL